MARKLIACLVVIEAAALAAPVTVLASGASAGDQQYVDPLAASHSATNSGSGQTSTASSSTAPAPTSSGTPSATSSSSSGTSSASSNTTTTGAVTGSTISTSGTTSGNQLPLTGYDVPLAVVTGVGLLALGACLHRATRKA